MKIFHYRPSKQFPYQISLLCDGKITEKLSQCCKKRFTETNQLKTRMIMTKLVNCAVPSNCRLLQTSREQRDPAHWRTSASLQGLVQVKYAKAVNHRRQYLRGEAFEFAAILVITFCVIHVFLLLLCLCFCNKLFNFTWRHFTWTLYCACVYEVTQRITTGIPRQTLQTHIITMLWCQSNKLCRNEHV